MKLLAPDISEAIDAEVDLFGRDAFAAGLLDLFSSSQDPLVVALDEKWGTGKTVFAKRLQRKAAADGFPVVYFDAFARDYEPDVFLALASSALSLLPKPAIKKAQLKERAKSVGKVLGRVALKGAVRLASGGALKASDFSEANEEIAEDVADAIEAELDSLIEQRLSRSQEEQQTFVKFRQALSEIAEQKTDGEKIRPVIFMVDELDRCRPDYALSIIETAKHLFSVPNVHFLLLCQMEQLAASIRKRYGNDIDAITYLEKFIHARVSFPIPEKHQRDRQTKQFVQRIVVSLPDDGEQGE